MKSIRMTEDEYQRAQALIKRGLMDAGQAAIARSLDAAAAQNQLVAADPAPKVSAHQKYRNRPTGGYSSRKEAERAAELKLLERAGKIRNLREQVPFLLIPAQKDSDGKTIERPCGYVADFVYEQELPDENGSGWRTVVEDCKGVRTPDYIIKRKLALYLLGIRIRET